MKHSAAQSNYITSIAVMQATQAKWIYSQTAQNESALDAAFDLHERRKRELFEWASKHSRELARAMGKPENELALVSDMFDKVIKGEFVRYEQEQKLITLCLKIII